MHSDLFPFGMTMYDKVQHSLGLRLCLCPLEGFLLGLIGRGFDLLPSWYRQSWV